MTISQEHMFEGNANIPATVKSPPDLRQLGAYADWELPTTTSERTDTHRNRLSLMIPIRVEQVVDKEMFIQRGDPVEKYLIDWKISNSEWIGLRRCQEHQVYLIKKRILVRERDIIDNLRGTSHKNLINLVEAFQLNDTLCLVYSHRGFAIDLQTVCVGSGTAFNDTEIATTCLNVLSGLRYVHEVLTIAHGDLSRRNIMLHGDGKIRIANIGDGLLKNSKDRRQDLKNLGHIVTYMSTPAAVLSADANNARNVSQQAKHFIEQLRTSTYRVIMAHPFLQQALPDTSGILIPHYLNTVARAWPLPRRAEWNTADL
ncbi:hypothetical protein KXV55_008391 [Aspergillus fumigatus]|nr:hypothetical protein CNMCM6069_008620 [Aspergillus lentulus]KAH2753701.1 hypothetical protein KXW10_003858 [Aspergillus fumigatus]KAH3517757.1 hypothetical protein KXV55_008391 [Aspergillus fumigatus]